MPKGGNGSEAQSNGMRYPFGMSTAHQTSQQFAPNNGMMMMNRGFGGGSQGSFMAPSNLMQMLQPRMPQLSAPTQNYNSGYMQQNAGPQAPIFSPSVMSNPGVTNDQVSNPNLGMNIDPELIRRLFAGNNSGMQHLM